jgi:hypothetical protein
MQEAELCEATTHASSVAAAEQASPGYISFGTNLPAVRPNCGRTSTVPLLHRASCGPFGPTSFLGLKLTPPSQFGTWDNEGVSTRDFDKQWGWFKPPTGRPLLPMVGPGFYFVLQSKSRFFLERHFGSCEAALAAPCSWAGSPVPLQGWPTASKKTVRAQCRRSKCLP